MKVFIGADHRGFNLKGIVSSWLQSNGYQVTDCGASELIPGDDYVNYAAEVARKVANEEGSRGIVICGSGAGVDIVANKTKRVRCALGLNAEQVMAARNDDDINVLALASDFINEQEATELVQSFLETNFEPTENHTRRIEKIKQLEN